MTSFTGSICSCGKSLASSSSLSGTPRCACWTWPLLQTEPWREERKKKQADRPATRQALPRQLDFEHHGEDYREPGELRNERALPCAAVQKSQTLELSISSSGFLQPAVVFLSDGKNQGHMLVKAAQLGPPVERIESRYPMCFLSILVGEPSPKKGVRRGT